MKFTLANRNISRRIGALVVLAIFLHLDFAAAKTTNENVSGSGPVAEKGRLAFHPIDHGRYQFGGVLGQRISANVDHWLLPAPSANPGMIEMFRVRDRAPVPNLVPWAGEFAGKYLISAIQALRMTDDEALRKQTADVVAQLIATQAEDGYLGPFPKAIRLKANWDLWGHYHCMEALLLWHDATGDEAALLACRRAADLICRTFLDQPVRIFDAGSHEMNMAILHGLGQLYRHTGEARYLRMMHEIEKDWERAGNYLRSGLSVLEFFQSPRPRWESLHDLQGLLELYRITGEEKYRTAFEHHWRSIVRWDRHNTGAFSSGEQATGNPYAPGAIETCCTIAWMALSVDMLSLTGDSRVADELELSTFNAAAGAQHPSGRWWTYNTPMDGVREASAHTIVFQSRAGTPELNCCSVNAPRSLGLLSEWAVMSSRDGLALNYFGPGKFTGRIADGTEVRLSEATDYPLDGRVTIKVEPAKAQTFKLHLRIPGWSKRTLVRVNCASVEMVKAGTYLELDRRWKKGDTIEVEFDMGVRFVTGDREAAGKVSLYRGPLLLAFDQRDNPFDESEIPPLNLNRLGEAKRVKANPESRSGTRDERRISAAKSDTLSPWLLLNATGSGARHILLRDYASAGCSGTHYRSWLAAENSPPPPAVTRSPADGASVPAAKGWFKWTTKTNSLLSGYQMLIADDPDFTHPAIHLKDILQNRIALDETQLRKLSPGRWYYWKIISQNGHGETESVAPAARFKVDASMVPAPEDLSAAIPAGPDGLLVSSSLREGPLPEFGKLKRASDFRRVNGPDNQPKSALSLNGQGQMLVYSFEEFPDENYAMSAWVKLNASPENHLGQMFSAWAGSMDDPLRVCVEKEKLFARIEAGQSYSTDGLVLETGAWHHLAAVKSESRFTLYLDGVARGSVAVPAYIHSAARNVALGGNPNYSGNEFLDADFAEFKFYDRALTADEIIALANHK
ncbi:MAG: beta-L-arabinofuranosidase domain-containing protein [Verrucomicrobiota bacterium]